MEIAPRRNLCEDQRRAALSADSFACGLTSFVSEVFSAVNTGLPRDRGDRRTVVEDARMTVAKRHPRIIYAAMDLAESLSQWDPALRDDERHPDRIAERLEARRQKTKDLRLGRKVT